MRVLLIGGGAREHAIGEALVEGGAELFVLAGNDNPGLTKLTRDGSRFAKHAENDAGFISNWALEHGIELAVVGLEGPLADGIPDKLNAAGIPTVGPVERAARLEISKRFMRDLMRRHDIPGQAEYHYFEDGQELAGFLTSTDKQLALKPDGLTAGKGVRVMGAQLSSVEEAIAYGQQVIAEQIGGAAGILLEERLEGEEFTLQSFVDGTNVIGMPLVRDYKRAFEGDEGPNTGSMGSYSQPDGLLPFVSQSEYDASLDVMRRTVDALRDEGTEYRGILYGQFMMTGAGIRVVEFNARFGDPEGANVLPLLESNLVEICCKIVAGNLQQSDVEFGRQATVCKYIAPPGYPDNPRTVALSFDEAKIRAEGVRLYFAKVEERADQLFTTGSRTAALVGIADTVDEAQQAVERALAHIKGEYHVRHDIGTASLLAASDRRVAAHSRPD